MSKSCHPAGVDQIRKVDWALVTRPTSGAVFLKFSLTRHSAYGDDYTLNNCVKST